MLNVCYLLSPVTSVVQLVQGRRVGPKVRTFFFNDSGDNLKCGENCTAPNS